MIDLKDLRENPEKYRTGSKLKNIPVDIDRALQLDQQRLAAQQEFERFRAKQNEASKQIGRLKDPAEKQAAIARMGELKSRVKEAEERSKALDVELTPLLLQIPQPPDA